MISNVHLPAPETADDWRQDATCRDLDNPDLMYPHPTDTVGIEDAKNVCRICPVLLACSAWALDRREKDGVWGGLDEKERARVLRRRKADPDAPSTQQLAPCGTPGAYRRHLRRKEPIDEDCRRAACRDQESKQRRRKQAA